MSNVTILFTGNDTVLEVAHLNNGLTGESLNGADVSVTLLDGAGQEVQGESWPLSLLYVTGSEGMYRVTLPHTLYLQANARYQAVVVVNGGPGLFATWTLDCVARDRS